MEKPTLYDKTLVLFRGSGGFGSERLWFMKKRIPVQVCPKCSGEGYVALSDAMEDTLKEVTRTPGFTASEIYERFSGVSVTAINNRLEDLRHMGFVRRERSGKCWRYFPDKGGMWE